MILNRRALRQRWGLPVLLPVLFFSLIPQWGGLHGQDRPFPYEFGTEGWAWASVGLGLTAVGLYKQGGVAPITLQEISLLSPETVNSFDRSATGNWSPKWASRSDTYRTGAIGAGLLILGIEGGRAAFDGRSGEALDLMAMFGEVVLLTAGTTYATKVIASRKRPYLFNQSLSAEERYEIASTGADEPKSSFFSGHASSAFAAATFASMVFQDIHGRSAWSNLVWGSTLSLATLTALSRVEAGVHYRSDIIVGALVGAGIGYLVPRLHRKDSRGDLTPLMGGFQLGYQIRF